MFYCFYSSVLHVVDILPDCPNNVSVGQKFLDVFMWMDGAGATDRCSCLQLAVPLSPSFLISRPNLRWRRRRRRRGESSGLRNSLSKRENVVDEKTAAAAAMA